MYRRLILACTLSLWFSNGYATAILFGPSPSPPPIIFDPPPSYIVTARLDLYDNEGAWIGGANTDGRPLFTERSVTFSDSSLISPFVVRDLTVISDADGKAHLSMLLDWGSSQDVDNEVLWSLAIADDFINQIAYYYYTSFDTDGDGVDGTRLTNVSPPCEFSADSPCLQSGMTANLTLSMASGVASAPAPLWLIFSGIAGLFGILGHRKRLSGLALKPAEPVSSQSSPCHGLTDALGRVDA